MDIGSVWALPLFAGVFVLREGDIYLVAASVQVRGIGSFVAAEAAAVPLEEGRIQPVDSEDKLEASAIFLADVHAWTISVGSQVVTVSQTVLVAITSLVITVELGWNVVHWVTVVQVQSFSTFCLAESVGLADVTPIVAAESV